MKVNPNSAAIPNMAVEYAKRWPESLTHLILVSTSAGPVSAQAASVVTDADLREQFRSVWPRFFVGDAKHWSLFERDLIAYAERAGFREIHLDLEVDIKPLTDVQTLNLTWESFMRSAANPKVPTLEEATAQALTKDEVARFAAHMRPLVKNRRGRHLSAVAFVSAGKNRGPGITRRADTKRSSVP
jgi:hypothetical protein